MLNHVSEERLALYLAGDLPDTPPGSIKDHLDACTRCRATLDDLKQSRALLTTSFAEPDTQDLFEVRTAVLAKLGQRQADQKHWRWGLAAAAAAIALVLPLRFMQKPAASPPQVKPGITPPLLATARPIPAFPLRVPEAKRSPVRRTSAGSGIRSATLLTRAGQPSSLRINTSDPNVVILWQFKEETQNP